MHLKTSTPILEPLRCSQCEVAHTGGIFFCAPAPGTGSKRQPPFAITTTRAVKPLWTTPPPRLTEPTRRRRPGQCGTANGTQCAGCCERCACAAHRGQCPPYRRSVCFGVRFLRQADFVLLLSKRGEIAFAAYPGQPALAPAGATATPTAPPIDRALQEARRATS